MMKMNNLTDKLLEAIKFAIRYEKAGLLDPKTFEMIKYREYVIGAKKGLTKALGELFAHMEEIAETLDQEKLDTFYINELVKLKK